MINTTKICFKCKEEKDLTNFHTHKKNKDGLSHICKPCSTQVNKEWREKNKEKWVEGYKKYSNLPQIKEKQKEYITSYRIDNKEKLNSYLNEYHKQQRLKNPLKKLSHYIRTNINNYIREYNSNKNQSTLEILGLGTWEEFKLYIEKQFTEGMNWENYGQGKNNETWHIDHKIPLASANSLEEIIKLNHYTNLQPMWCSDNIRKKDKINLVS